MKWEPLNKEQLVDTLVDDDFLREFFIKNDIDTTFIEDNLQSLFVFKVENDNCKNCEEGRFKFVEINGKQIKFCYPEINKNHNNFIYQNYKKLV